MEGMSVVVVGMDTESVTTLGRGNTSAPRWQSQTHRGTGSKSHADHDESMMMGEWTGDLGSIATGIMRPRSHCGHCRKERPVSSS